MGAVHVAHSTGADLLHYAVVAESLANHGVTGCAGILGCTLRQVNASWLLVERKMKMFRYERSGTVADPSSEGATAARLAVTTIFLRRIADNG